MYTYEKVTLLSVKNDGKVDALVNGTLELEKYIDKIIRMKIDGASNLLLFQETLLQPTHVCDWKETSDRVLVINALRRKSKIIIVFSRPLEMNAFLKQINWKTASTWSPQSSESIFEAYPILLHGQELQNHGCQQNGGSAPSTPVSPRDPGQGGGDRPGQSPLTPGTPPFAPVQGIKPEIAQIQGNTQGGQQNGGNAPGSPQDLVKDAPKASTPTPESIPPGSIEGNGTTCQQIRIDANGENQKGAPGSTEDPQKQGPAKTTPTPGTPPTGPAQNNEPQIQQSDTSAPAVPASPVIPPAKPIKPPNVPPPLPKIVPPAGPPPPMHEAPVPSVPGGTPRASLMQQIQIGIMLKHVSKDPPKKDSNDKTPPITPVKPAVTPTDSPSTSTIATSFIDSADRFTPKSPETPPVEDEPSPVKGIDQDLKNKMDKIRRVNCSSESDDN